ncbi:TraR/DksA C4-type zinc finger protein [Pseudomonas mosselii]|uniref:TraR/DksA C4-type zinc finger protein n=1 Tax=Pseudomonas mosselii TaxID=78327 RepID=A0A7W2JT78_9PSED|nr:MULTISPECIES: TraR/DksA C4-type zinc finger protein [Pseudomonas]KXG79236.1 conjugal transfer protein TraR [Pseudomonas mosselii]MBA6064706.1 TraR/DksA C4-type zinc finger protein [Pseudomonas mosselii]MBS9761352.1 TraR/DksA C4-type zinc finger protein [Pseudomonas mosselii]MDH0627238.1 TraR/DksA C4-type zinc finger protein [Pseudomonas mosselii]MDH0678991.1 TraR/DksA C4-type zinc finger protein [Pseudomonas mosselii]
MVCPFDRAQALEQLRRDLAIAAVRGRRVATGPSLTHCTDCGDEIAEARRALGGMRRCIPCQQLHERDR